MNTYHTKQQLMAAGFALALVGGAQTIDAALLIDLDLRGLGNESDAITSLTNAGTLGGSFAAVGTGAVVTTVGGVQGLTFADNKYNSSMNSPLTGNVSYSATAWVHNPAVAGEEAIVAWGARAQGNGANAGFHQGSHNEYGAVGHWSGDYDVPWGNGGTDITPTIGTWTHLAWSYDSTTLTESVYINGVLSNTKTFPAGLSMFGPVPFAIGSEHGGAPDLDLIQIPFSGTIGSVKVWDEAQDQTAIQADFAQGIPEPSSAALTMLGLLSFAGLRRRR